MNATVAPPARLTLKARTAADLMTSRVVSIAEHAPLREVVATLVDRGFSGAPVVNDAGRAVGVVSLSDIVVHDRNTVAYAKPAGVFAGPNCGPGLTRKWAGSRSRPSTGPWPGTS